MQGNTTQNINEHQPLVLINNTAIICTLVVLLAVLIFTKAKIRMNDLCMIGGLILLMFISKRQTTMFIIMGSVILNRLIYLWMNENIKDIDEKIVNSIINKFGVFMMTSIILILSLIFIKPNIKAEYIDANSYPVEMSDFIINYFKEQGKDLSEIRLYNEYNYGSYLLYRGIPVFIDSRADLYAPEFNKEIDIFTDFIESSNLSVYFGDIFEKYDITHVILYKNSKVNMIIRETKLKGYKLLKADDNFVFYEIEK